MIDNDSPKPDEPEPKEPEEGQPSESGGPGESVNDDSSSGELEKLRDENRLLLEQAQRSMAELANFRRRVAQERLDNERRTTIRVFREVIPLIDDLQRALEQAESSDHEQIKKGLQIVVDKFVHILADFQIEKLAAKGESFDPNLHEAMVQLETDEVAPGTIVEEFIKGYRLGDELVRPARVSVAKAPENAEA